MTQQLTTSKPREARPTHQLTLTANNNERTKNITESHLPWKFKQKKIHEAFKSLDQNLNMKSF